MTNTIFSGNHMYCRAFTKFCYAQSRCTYCKLRQAYDFVPAADCYAEFVRQNKTGSFGVKEKPTDDKTIIQSDEAPGSSRIS